METVKNLDGKTVCRADLERQQIEIVFKGNKSLVWFDPAGRLHQIHEPTEPLARPA